MGRVGKFLALSLLVCATFFVGARESVAGVCEDNRDFCIAGCTSTSPKNCRSRCLTEWCRCVGPIKCPQTGPGGD